MNYLKPNLCCSKVSMLDFKNLSDLGIRNYCFDLDNTLALRNSNIVSQEIKDAINLARELKYIENICLVSNIIMGGKRAARVRSVADSLNISHCYAADFWHRKPKATPFLEAMNLMNSQPKNTAIVGDQLFTDILGGNRLGLYTILVKPLGDDHWATSLTGRRIREKRLLEQMGLSF